MPYPDKQRVQNSKTAISRRNVLKASGASLIGTSLAGCIGGLSGGDGSTELVMSISGGSWGEWVEEYFVTPWEEDTGNSIDVRFEGGGTRDSKLQANRDDPIYDLSHGSNTDAIRWGAQELLVNQEETVEAFEDVSEAFRNEWLAGKVLTPFGIGYNSGAVDKEVTSWEDLLDPAFEGKVAVPSWGWMGASWLYVINDVQGGSVEDIQPGLDFVDKLINEQNAVVMENTDAGLRLFQNEEILIAPYWSARTDQITLDSDIDMTFVYPDEGAFKSFYNLAIVGDRGEERQTAAADFVSSTLIPERQAEFSSSFGYPPTNPEAVQHMDDQVIEDRPSLDISEEDMNNMAQIEIDWVEVTNRRSEHAEDWREIVRG